MLELPEGGEVHLGSGLRPVGDDVVALKCGVVRQTQRGKLWLEGRQKRCVVVQLGIAGVVGVVAVSGGGWLPGHEGLLAVFCRAVFFVARPPPSAAIVDTRTPSNPHTPNDNNATAAAPKHTRAHIHNAATSRPPTTSSSASCATAT